MWTAYEFHALNHLLQNYKTSSDNEKASLVCMFKSRLHRLVFQVKLVLLDKLTHRSKRQVRCAALRHRSNRSRECALINQDLNLINLV